MAMQTSKVECFDVKAAVGLLSTNITRIGFQESTDSARFFILPEVKAIIAGPCSCFGVFDCF